MLCPTSILSTMLALNRLGESVKAYWLVAYRRILSESLLPLLLLLASLPMTLSTLTQFIFLFCYKGSSSLIGVES